MRRSPDVPVRVPRGAVKIQVGNTAVSTVVAIAANKGRTQPEKRSYAMRWNNQMYSDYSRAYIDIADDDPNTKSYETFIKFGNTINETNIEQWKSRFKSRKDRFRRWRDLSFFCMVGVYGLSIIDAYVDASLSQFDISDDLSLHVEPGIVGTTSTNTGIGINAALTF